MQAAVAKLLRMQITRDEQRIRFEQRHGRMLITKQCLYCAPVIAPRADLLSRCSFLVSS